MSQGHFVQYVKKDFRQDALDRIDQANSIIAEYEQKGMAITLRQLYYQLVARGMMENVPANYDRLGALISDARLAGLVSWTAIEDRGRFLRGHETFESPEAAMKKAHDSYKIDMWANQEWRPEVWVEKAALEGVIGSIAGELRVDFFATRGYNSQSEQWRAGRRFARYISKGQRPIVFHLADHDPSGIDMTRDAQERLSLFAGTNVLVQRIALNMNQVEQYKPPPNPAKVKDPRALDYIAKFGGESWELDALEPSVIRQLIYDAVMRVRDPAKWEEMFAQEVDDKEVIGQFIEEGNDKDRA